MIYGFAQICALLMLSRYTRFLLLPLGLLALPIYDLTHPHENFSEMANDCAKETYKRGQENSKAIAAIEKCIELKRIQKNAAKAQK